MYLYVLSELSHFIYFSKSFSLPLISKPSDEWKPLYQASRNLPNFISCPLIGLPRAPLPMLFQGDW